MEILISNKAEKQLRSLPQAIQEKVRDIFIRLELEGLRTNIDIKKLKGY